METQKAHYPITLMARILGVTRAGYYAWRKRGVARERQSFRRREFDRHVCQVFAASRRTCGAVRIRLALAREGIGVCEPTVVASMRRQQLVALSSRSFVKPGRKAEAEEKVVDLCGRCWDQGGLDLVWVTDFTYLRCGEGRVYLVAVRDAHSRRVVGWAMAEHMRASLAGGRRPGDGLRDSREGTGPDCVACRSGRPVRLERAEGLHGWGRRPRERWPDRSVPGQCAGRVVLGKPEGRALLPARPRHPRAGV